jgi:hypothetical protein
LSEATHVQIESMERLNVRYHRAGNKRAEPSEPVRHFRLRCISLLSGGVQSAISTRRLHQDYASFSQNALTFTGVNREAID